MTGIKDRLIREISIERYLDRYDLNKTIGIIKQVFKEVEEQIVRKEDREWVQQ
jgi:hypothetical protein